MGGVTLDNEYVRRLSIQRGAVVRRLYAEICMVLVATLLITNVSYAWMTLSAAPEVTKVKTTIGANGNLEIALGKNIGGSQIGDSFVKSGVTAANRTWGNLIDLTDESYGLQAITLRPAILNSAGGAINMLHPLAYPIYGNDGRVQYIYANNLFAGTYDGSQFVTAANDYGVHGIGTTQYYALGMEGTFGSLSQRQEVFYNAQDALWGMTSSSYMTLCDSSESVLRAYCIDGAGISAEDFDLNAFSDKVDAVVSAANEELRLIFTLLAASETTSADNYFMSMELLKQKYPDYEMIRTLVASAVRAEGVEDVDTAIAELRAFQDAAEQLQTVIDSGAVDGSDGYSMEEIAQTVGLIFDLEKTGFSETSKDYWSEVIPHLHYRRYKSGKYWWWTYPDKEFAVNDLTSSLSDSEGQDNDSREAAAYEIAHTHTYSLYRSLPLQELDIAIVGLYSSHWSYWDNCAEQYQQLQEAITELESQVRELKISGTSEEALLQKTNELAEEKAQLQSLIDGETYALDDERVEALRTVMTDTVEILRQYALWSIAYCACDGRVPDDAYHRLLEIASSTESIQPRTAYEILCNYGVTPQEELANLVAAYEKLKQELTFLQTWPNDAEAFTWSEISEELQRVFGNITHQFYFYDEKYDRKYSSNYSVEDVSYPIAVMEEIREEIDKCEDALGFAPTEDNLEHWLTYEYTDEENMQPWARALGVLNTFSTDYYPFKYGDAEYTLEGHRFSTGHSMWYTVGFWLSISIGVGSEDNFNESGLTVRQTRFREAQKNISYYQGQLITAATTPDKDMIDLLLQMIAGESKVSLVTVSKYLDSLQQQLEYGEAMMYQATMAMAASDYAKDDVYQYAYSDRAPKDAAGMIALLQSYDFDGAVLNAFAHRMELLNSQEALLKQSLELLKAYQDAETGALKTEQIPASEAAILLKPVLDTGSLILYGYVADERTNEEDLPSYVHTVLYTGYGSPSAQISGNQISVTGREPVTVFGNVYLSLGESLSGGMLALAKSQTESYVPPTVGLNADEIGRTERDGNRHSYTIDASGALYTLNLRTADAPYSLETDLWEYTGNTDYISAGQTLVDIYGYSIDLSFRTNAENSDLLLQTEAIDRIYNDGEAQTEATMGAGSYMQFRIIDRAYSPEMAKEYMSCLRVVFTDANTGYIYGYAALDMDGAEVLNDEIKAPLMLCDKDTGALIEGDNAQYLCHLEKNQEKNLTLYVYLEGAKVSQPLVSATGEQTLSGVMNLQFRSSADLKPAALGDLRE